MRGRLVWEEKGENEGKGEVREGGRGSGERDRMGGIKVG